MKNSLRPTIRKMRYFFLFIFAFLLEPLFSQSMLQYETPAPEVGSLLRIQSLPIDLFSGRANISIPLYSIALKNYSYDIQLQYNSEGNKVDLPVSNVGLGWSISGGQIYRITHAYPDEIYTFNEYQNRTEIDDWDQESNLSKYYDLFNNNVDYNHEPDLDEFIINIGQINASFYMYKDRNGNIQTRISSQNSPYFQVKNVKIGALSDILLTESEWEHPIWDKTYHPKLYISPSSATITEITIVDSKGITYVFGGDINTIDLSCRYLQDSNYEKYYDIYGRPFYEEKACDSFNSFLFGTACTWHIKKIILPNQENIAFNYNKGNINIIERFDHHKSSTLNFTGITINSNTIPGLYMLPSDVNPQYRFLIDKKYDIVYPSSLANIKVSNGDYIEFVSSQRNDLPTYGFYSDQMYFLKDNYGALNSNILDKSYYYKLNEIKSKTRNIRLYYTDQNDQRLKLDSLTINNTEKYKFQYNPLKLPGFNQMLTDNWGYYNGKKYLALINTQRFEALYDYRQPDSTYVKAEILEKIIYPTGGEIDMEYELHDYSKIATQYPFGMTPKNGMAGGVRVKRITMTDSKQSPQRIVKDYLYQNEDHTSSGILSVVPQYATSGTGTVDYDLKYTHLKGPYSYSNKSTTNINWVDGFHMGYSLVTELLSDGSKTVYSFVNHDQVQDEPSSGALTLGMNNAMYNKCTSRKLDRGLLKSIDKYDAVGKLQKKETFTYHSDLSNYLKTIGRYALLNTLPIRVSANKIYTYFPFLQKKETTLYTDCDSINETEEYEYNQYRLLTSTKKYTNEPSDNSMLETRTKYLSDLMEESDSTTSGTISSGSPLKVYDTMRSQGMLSYPVETVVRRNGKVTSSEVTTYKLSGQLAVQDKQYKLESDASLGDYTSFKLLNATQDSIDPRCALNMEFLDYDSYGNPKNVADKAGVKTTYIWGYNGLYPIAKVINAQNTFKSVPRYIEYIKTKSIRLDQSSFNEPVYLFNSSKAGTVEVRLPGGLGYNWFLTVNIDGQTKSLVQVRSNKRDNPWNQYLSTYKFNAEFDLPAGSHSLKIQSIQVYNGTSQQAYEGELTYSYWTKENITPETSGTDDTFYENFETVSSCFDYFGYNSEKSYIGAYVVSMVTNPEREYFIDYQVFKDGKWNYVKHDFLNKCDTIDEGKNPIDDVRIYPKDASITTYSYFPLIGLRGTTNERGITESYRYNDSGKLATVMDNDMNIINKYNYSYQGQASKPEVTYYNSTMRETFTRNTCNASLGEIGKSIEYMVPAKKYSSSLSQEDANQKAYTDLLNNGQQYANEHAECSSNIYLSVYNPTGTDHLLTFHWGVQGSIRTDYYNIPASRKIGDTGDILQDYEPVIVYIPRKFYRDVQVSPQESPYAYVEFSLKSTPASYGINYAFENFTDHEDIGVIGGYPFLYEPK